jgi:hypothetical protein
MGEEDSQETLKKDFSAFSIRAKEASMSCPYFKDGYFGICVAFESIYVPSIEKMETYCFGDQYGLCPNLATYLSGNSMKPALSHEEDISLVRRV